MKLVKTLIIASILSAFATLSVQAAEMDADKMAKDTMKMDCAGKDASHADCAMKDMKKDEMKDMKKDDMTDMKKDDMKK